MLIFKPSLIFDREQDQQPNPNHDQQHNDPFVRNSSSIPPPLPKSENVSHVRQNR